MNNSQLIALCAGALIVGSVGGGYLERKQKEHQINQLKKTNSLLALRVIMLADTFKGVTEGKTAEELNAYFDEMSAFIQTLENSL